MAKRKTIQEAQETPTSPETPEITTPTTENATPETEQPVEASAVAQAAQLIAPVVTGDAPTASWAKGQPKGPVKIVRLSGGTTIEHY